jgi:PAS domain S-box-containing protein
MITDMKHVKTTPAPVAPRPDGLAEGAGVPWLIIGFAGLIPVALFTLAGSQGQDPFQFRFNIYALLSLAALLCNIVTFVLIMRLKAKTDDVLWFTLYIGSLIMWAASESLIRLSATPETAVFWSASRSLGAYIMPVAFYMFAVSYTNARRLRQTLIFAPLMLISLILLFFDYRTSFFNVYEPAALLLKPWGYITQTGPYYALMIAWILLLCGASVIMFFRFSRLTQDPTLRRQTQLFIIAVAPALFIGGFVDGVLPSLGNVGVLPVVVMLTTLMSVVLSYGVLRYQLFSFNPASVAPTILETMNEAVIAVRPDMHINYANHGAEQLLGYEPGQMIKLQLADLFGGGNDHGLVKHLLSPLADHATLERETMELHRADGGKVTVKLSISLVADDRRAPGYLIVMTDITLMAEATQVIEQTVERRTREVREAKATLDTSLNSLELGFLITDTNTKVTMANQAAHDMFCGSSAHDPAQCANMTLDRVQSLVGDHVQMERQLKARLEHQRAHELKDVTFNHKIWRIYLSPMVVDGVSIGCAILFQDTTQERLLERSRDEFFSIASHELRTPLTAIKGNASLILQYYQDVLKDPQLQEMVVDIHDSGERLIMIVNDFLDASRLEQKRIDFDLKSMKVMKVAEAVAYEMAQLLNDKHIYLKLDPSLAELPDVIADHNRLKQVFYNLIGNAAKFTEQGGITIAAVMTGKSVKVTFTDTGFGISPEQQLLLFRKFQQAGSSLLTRDTSRGTGLGLYISRLLIAGMGGALKLDHSVPGKGSVFSLTLPLATPARLKKLALAATAADAKSANAHNTKP